MIFHNIRNSLGNFFLYIFSTIIVLNISPNVNAQENFTNYILMSDTAIETSVLSQAKVSFEISELRALPNNIFVVSINAKKIGDFEKWAKSNGYYLEKEFNFTIDEFDFDPEAFWRARAPGLNGTKYWHLNDWDTSNLKRSNVHDIDVQTAWLHEKGDASLKVAVIDTGLRVTQKFIENNVYENAQEVSGTTGVDDDGNGFVDDISGWNFITNNGDVTDLNGHGTAMAGLVAASGIPSDNYTGVMWNGSIVPIVACDASGVCPSTKVILAIDYAIKSGAKVINLSLSSSQFSQPYKSIIEFAGTKNILITTSAGNDGKNVDIVPAYPCVWAALYDHVICVGATDEKSKLASFSNFGTKVSIGSPGVNLYSVAHWNDVIEPQLRQGGTSEASAIVAGVAGLVFSRFPSLQAAKVKAQIIKGGKNVSLKFGNNKIVNARGALKHGDPIDGVPSNLQFSTSSAGGRKLNVVVKWNDNSSNETLYVVLSRRPNSNDWCSKGHNVGECTFWYGGGDAVYAANTNTITSFRGFIGGNSGHVEFLKVYACNTINCVSATDTFKLPMRTLSKFFIGWRKRDKCAVASWRELIREKQYSVVIERKEQGAAAFSVIGRVTGERKYCDRSVKSGVKYLYRVYLKKDIPIKSKFSLGSSVSNRGGYTNELSFVVP